ncbi:transporter substrate-binding domain-containing protein [Niveibacterium sp. 24ML]|uniref:substrate-binding periplasmic protein n=1 Tax=Niveibacterium sp. 24ML TaxID=2985512 RepID=UPI00226D4BB4|nr:transporter substrate-binding domain-containing protein [Niveibacterium sp. 24ML]MCX9155592.1 transporter substrate-binding domain-containing protein [Niveibacterium sp. 24ML]
MLQIARIALIAVAFACAASASGKETLVRYPRGDNPTDFRYDYPVRMLQLALDKTSAEDGPARAVQATEPMSNARVQAEIERGGLIDVANYPPKRELANRLQFIPICIRKGILGIRIFIIDRKLAPRFAAVRSLDDLKHLSAGQQKDWLDTKILLSNGIPVVTPPSYEEIFELLAAGRFDYFPRGVHEPYREVEPRALRFPDLMVEESLALYYPMPDYFVVSKGNTALAHRIQRGLERAIADGSYDALFQKEFSESLRRAKLAQRTIIRLENPDLDQIPNPDDQKRWLLPPAAARKVTAQK